MKKEYIPIKSDHKEFTEIERIEHYWTRTWEDTLESVEGENFVDLKKREEYRLMAPYLNELSGGKRILDAGCGMGEWIIFLSPLGYDVYGVDISLQTISWLKKKFPQYRFLHGDIRRLDFPDNYFDACFSWGVFEHFEEGMGLCINEAWRVLRPQGHLFISVPFQNWRHIFRDARSLNRGDEFYNPEFGYSDPMRFYQWRFTIPELERELIMGGFRVIKIHPIAKREGMNRALKHDFHLLSGSLLFRIAGKVLSGVLPQNWISHMLIAIAQKNK